MGGIYGGDVDQLSLGETFPELAAMEREHGSLTAGARAKAAATSTASAADAPSAFVSLAGGMDTLVSALTGALGEGTLQAGTRVASVEMRHTDQGNHFRAVLSDGSFHEGQDVVFAMPAPAAIALIHPLAPHVARGLAQLRHISTAVVSLGFRERDVGTPLDGYGFLVAGDEGLPIRGCTWSSTKLAGRAPEGHVLVRAFVGGIGREGDVALDGERLVSLATGAIAGPLRLTGEAVYWRVDRWPKAQPQYELGHRERGAQIRSGTPAGAHFIGASYDGVGLPAVIRSARRTAVAILERGVS
jgi:oxygen-dependent protoporphyrinogen oxidase